MSEVSLFDGSQWLKTTFFYWKLCGKSCVSYCIARRLVLLPGISRMLGDVYPEERDSMPDLHTLSMEAALFINHGSPFLGDGLRYEHSIQGQDFWILIMQKIKNLTHSNFYSKNKNDKLITCTY